MRIQDYLKEHILLTDGAMGTYYDQLYGGEDGMAEVANLSHPERIFEIHRSYVESGARLLRTNTFALNESSVRQTLPDCKDVRAYIEENLKAAVSLARKAASECQEKVFVAADIGPIAVTGEEDHSREEYRWLIDLFLEAGVDLFVLETFSHSAPVIDMADYIKKKAPDSFVLGQFSVNPTGYSQMGKSVNHIFQVGGQSDSLDGIGLNCSIGASHMLKFLNRVEMPVDKFVSALPNGGYPQILRGKMRYPDSAAYFGDMLEKMLPLGVNILGGCCGTTPDYIGKIKERIEGKKPAVKKEQLREPKETVTKKRTYPLMEKMNGGKKIIAVELDPPFNEDITKFMEGAYTLKEKGVNVITIADSPMARSRADALLVAAKLKREVGITVLPHFTCRDRNRISVRSSILGAYLNEIRDMLLVTGDPVGPADKDNTKGVFDFNSIRMMEFLNDMNEEHFSKEPICIGGALNQNSASLEVLIKRTEKKIKAGASFFLTQPMYDEESIARIATIKEQLDTKILCGIMPLVSYRNAMFIKNEMPGIHVPEEVAAQYSPEMTKEEAEEVAVRISLNLMRKMKNVTDGYYFMVPFNRVSLIGRIIDEIKSEDPEGFYEEQ